LPGYKTGIVNANQVTSRRGPRAGVAARSAVAAHIKAKQAVRCGEFSLNASDEIQRFLKDDLHEDPVCRSNAGTQFE